MIRVRFFRSFDETVEDLSRKEQAKVRAAMDRLLEYFNGGPKPLGLGLRKLRGDYWEVRVSEDKRIMFLLQDDVVSFLIAGSHDDIRRYLSRQ